MTYVSWEDASEFCRKLTASERAAGRLPSGWSYTLPTEAQWEYACRAGTTGPYNGDGTGVLSDYAWYDSNADDVGEKYAHPVGQKKANRWGLLDMHGNVWEWCQDWYGEKLPGGRDPLLSSGGSYRVYRGGSWDYSAWGCRSANRGGLGPSWCACECVWFERWKSSSGRRSPACI
ncbi:MAG: formylglycine-generating enzyme family protein [Planctomycetaceae bacterium]